MKTSITYLKSIGKGLLIALFWLAVWQAAAMAVGTELLLPSPVSVVRALAANTIKSGFWISVGASMLRVLTGFLLALLAGTLLGLLSARVRIMHTLFSPVIKTVRAAPVASFIILALVWISTDILPAFISFLMGLPIVWQGVEAAALSEDTKLTEAAKIFGITGIRRFRLVTVPAVFPAFLSSAVTCLGFCWKSAVAAEVICLPKNAIGHLLYSAKNSLETPEVFAYTVVTVVFSVIIEATFRQIVKGVSKNAH